MELLNVFCVLFLIISGISVFVTMYYGCFRYKSNPSTYYLLNGKKMKVLPVAFSLIASNVTGTLLMGIPAEIYMYGSQYWLLIIAIFLTGFLVSYIYLPVFYNLQLCSVFEYLEIRFDRKIRKIASLASAVTNFVLLPLVIYAPCLAFNQVSGIDLHLSSTVLSLICIVYASTGGVRSTIWTDTVQFFVTVCTLSCVVVVGTTTVGGVGSVWEKAKIGSRLEFFNLNPDPTTRTTLWSAIFGNMFVYMACYGFNQANIQRLLSVPSLNDSKKTLTIGLAMIMVIKSILCFSGLVIYAQYYDCDPLTTGRIRKPDQILPYYISDLSSHIPGLTSLFVAGLFSTAISSFSANLNAIAGITYQDFIKSFVSVKSSEKYANIAIKLLMLFIGTASISLVFVMEKLGTIIELTQSLLGITEGPILGLFTLGLLFPFANRKGAYCGLITSVSFMAFIIVGNQYLVWNNQVSNVPKPLYTFGCNATASHLSSRKLTAIPSNNLPEEPFWLFKISFFYYVMMGTMICVTVGCVVSWFTRSSNDLVNSDLVSPCVRRFLPKPVLQDCCTIEAKAILVDSVTINSYGAVLEKISKPPLPNKVFFS